MSPPNEETKGENMGFHPVNFKEIPFVPFKTFSESGEQQRYFLWKKAENYFRDHFPINEFSHISFEKAKYLFDVETGDFIGIFENLLEGGHNFLSRYAFRVKGEEM